MKPQLHVFSTKPPSSSSSSSTLSTMKIKTLIHTLIISHVCRVIRALSKAKSILVQILKENQPIYSLSKRSKHSRQRKILFGSFRLHYNWCSSHVLPVPTPHLYYDSTWNSIISPDNNNNESQLAGYLQWLEEKVKENENTNNNNNNGGEGEEEEGIHEIDQLADMFIANCHEKFRLEKQESYRRFQEMMARSM